MKSPIWSLLFALSSLVSASCHAGEREFLQSLVYDAIRQSGSWTSQNGYSLETPNAESIEISTGLGTTLAGSTMSSAITGNNNRYFSFTVSLTKGGDRYILDCRGYYTQLHWQVGKAGNFIPVATPLAAALDRGNNERLGSDCSLKKYHAWWFNESVEVPKGKPGEGLISLTYDPNDYKNKLTASLNQAAPATLEARSLSELPAKRQLGDPDAAGSKGLAPVKSSTEEAL